MIKIEITKDKNKDGEYILKGGDTLDYLSMLADVIASLCKKESLPVELAVKGLFHELEEAEVD